MQSSKSKAHYSQHQSIQWLSNLAKNMQRENEHIFFIEQLQPTWINADRRYMALVGLFAGLVIGLFEGLILGSTIAIRGAFWQGGLIGLVGGCSAALSNGLNGSISGFIGGGIRNKWVRFIITLLSFLFLDNVLGSRIGVAISSIVVEPYLGFSFGLSGGLLGGLLLGLSLWHGEIQRIERLTLVWPSLQQVTKNVGRGSLIGLMAGIISGAYNALSVSKDAGMFVLGTLVTALIYSLTGAALSAVLATIQARKTEEQSLPNQGIRNSFTNAYRLAILGGVVAGWAGWLQDQSFHTSGWFLGAGIELGILGAFFYFGGSSVIKHYVLRLWLVGRRILPWRLIPFLDEMTDLIFLQRVGGGYTFFHPILLEHFANI